MGNIRFGRKNKKIFKRKTVLSICVDSTRDSRVSFADFFYETSVMLGVPLSFGRAEEQKLDGTNQRRENRRWIARYRSK